MNPLVLTLTLIYLYSLDFWAVALYRMMTYDSPFNKLGIFFSVYFGAFIFIIVSAPFPSQGPPSYL